MPRYIEITDFHDPALDAYVRLTGAQQRCRKEPEKGIFIAESPTDYLAITAVNYVDAEMPQGDGTSITVQNSRYTYELIPKDEFCSDSYASRTVQWVD